MKKILMLAMVLGLLVSGCVSTKTPEGKYKITKGLVDIKASNITDLDKFDSDVKECSMVGDIKWTVVFLAYVVKPDSTITKCLRDKGYKLIVDY